jgi:alanine-synthesizing transaminase
MFSRRLPWPCPVNRLSRLLEEKRRGGVRILDLTESNPTGVGLDYPDEAIVSALATPGSAKYRPSPRGLPAARQAVAEYHARLGRPVDPETILLTASSSEAYSILFKALADPGDAILVPQPSYPLFEYLAGLEAVKVAAYPLVYDGRWEIDLKALERRVIAENPRAVVLVNPNNPTGSALTGRERRGVEAICAKRGIAIISDEVFFDYLHEASGGPGAGRTGDDRPVSMASPPGGRQGPEALAFTLGGLSKSCGLPQMKLGWILATGPAEVAKEALDRLELIADTYLSVGTPVQEAAFRLLALGDVIREAIRARIRENLSVLEQEVAPGSPCRLLASDGGWYSVVQVPAVVPEEELVLWLLAYDDVLAHPGYFFDFPREAYLVLSLLPPPGDFREAVRRILDRTSSP